MSGLSIAAIASAIRGRLAQLAAGVAAVAVLWAPPAAANHGALDTTFGSGGVVFTDVAGLSGDQIASLRLQLLPIRSAGGGFVGFRETFVAGAQAFKSSSDPSRGIDGAVVVARYDKNGRLDPSFDGDGIAVTTFDGSVEVRAAIPSGGKIIAGGPLSIPGVLDKPIALVRYNGDGTLDRSFGGDGKVVQGFEGASSFNTNSFAVDTRGRVVVGGSAFVEPPPRRMAVMRLKADGSLDDSVGIRGARWDYVQFPDGIGEPEAILPQSDGAILVVGTFAGAPVQIAVARFREQDLHPDSAFGTGGMRKLSTSPLGLPPGAAAGAVVVRDGGGRYVVGATGRATTASRPNGIQRWVTARIKPLGDIDVSWGGFNGRVVTFFSEGGEQELGDLLLDTQDGTITGVGTTRLDDLASEPQFALARHRPDGSLDPTFGIGGKVLTNLTPAGDAATSILRQLGPRLVAGGSSGGRLALVGYHGRADDRRPFVRLKVQSSRLRSVLRRRLVVEIRSDEAIAGELIARVPGARPRMARTLTIGRRPVVLTEGGRRLTRLALTLAGQRALAGLRRARVTVVVRARDGAGNSARARAQRTLRR